MTAAHDTHSAARLSVAVSTCPVGAVRGPISLLIVSILPL